MADGAFRQVIRRLVPRRLRWLARAAFKRITGLYYRDMMARLWDVQNQVNGIQDSVSTVHEIVGSQAVQIETQGEVMDLLLRRLRVSQEEVVAHLGAVEKQVATQLHGLENTQDALRSDLLARLVELQNTIHLLTPLALASTMYWTVSAEDALGDNELVMSRALSNFYVRFQSLYRGSEELIRERQRPLLAHFARCQRVLDIGCGRGEFLELLREQRIPAEGIDIDPSAVDICRAKGGTAHEAEALAYLSTDGAGTFDGIHMNHLIEHLTFPTVVRLLEACLCHLQPGGVFLAQTPNPYCPEALQAFFLDPTHVRPLFPDVVTMLLESLGFEQVEVHFVSPVREEEDGTPQRGPQDFADYFIVAVKPPVERPTTSTRKQARSSKRPRKRGTSAKRR